MLALGSLTSLLDEGTSGTWTSARGKMVDADLVDTAPRSRNLQALVLTVMATVLDTAKAAEDEHLVGVRSVKVHFVRFGRPVDEVCQSGLLLAWR